MKNFSLLAMLVVCCAFGLMPGSSYAQKRSLSAAELDSVVRPSLAQCQNNVSRIDAASIIPTTNAREFPPNRIAKTLHGTWTGRIIGDSQDVGVDYFWIMDTVRREGLIIALRNGKQTLPRPANAATAPKLTFLLCANAGYVPSKDTPMMHEFVKVSDSIEDAPQILQKATGVKVSKARPTLSDLWQGLLASKYFQSMPAMAFAGALFKPMRIGRVANVSGPAGHSLSWDSEYRGGGATSIKYTIGVPMTGVEHGEFVGTTTNSGDFIVSSPGNGKIWKVEASMIETSDVSPESKGTFPVICYDLVFDKVVLGPLKPAVADRRQRR